MTVAPLASPDDVLHFWFEEPDSANWWKSSPVLDRRIAERFGPTLAAAARCELYAWRVRQRLTCARAGAGSGRARL